jgi:hypothetical protein
MRQPFSALRLVVTVPPPEWFGGVDHARARDQIDALIELGARVYEFGTAAAYAQDSRQLQSQIEDIRVFRPDAVIGTPHAGYAVQGGMVDFDLRPGGERPRNLFLDELGIPIILYWDHVLTQAPYYLTRHWPKNASESVGGALDHLRELLVHPRAVHFFPDTGHMDELHKLGIAALDDDPWFVTAVHQDFVAYGTRAFRFLRRRGDDLAFFGNIYLAASKRLPYEGAPGVSELRDRALVACAANWGLPPYRAYKDAVVGRPMHWLDPDQSFYWRFLYDELSIVANAGHRLRILTASGRPVAFFGGFADPDSRAAIAAAGCVPRGSLPYGKELAAAYNRTRITLDVVNGPFITGFSPKLLECFAAGGFCLTTRRADLKRAFGDLGEAIGFSNAGELAAKIDHYLTRRRERRSVTREMQEIIRRDHTVAALFSRTLPMALDRLRARGAGRT